MAGYVLLRSSNLTNHFFKLASENAVKNLSIVNYSECLCKLPILKFRFSIISHDRKYVQQLFFSISLNVCKLFELVGYTLEGQAINFYNRVIVTLNRDYWHIEQTHIRLLASEHQYISTRKHDIATF